MIILITEIKFLLLPLRNLTMHPTLFQTTVESEMCYPFEINLLEFMTSKELIDLK